MKLNVNVVVYNPKPDMTKYATNPNDKDKFKPSLEFKGYISVSDHSNTGSI